jgi:SAM-dependent methyltransferase
MTNQKTHHDFVDLIGETHKTGRHYLERRWNNYYATSYQRVVAQMLEGVSGTVLDVGTSYGHWLPFLKAQGFAEILGVEIDPGRAEHARRAGYSTVFNSDASVLPIADGICDAAVSNDVFVHILRMEDKKAVLREVERVLRPGGIFIVNHAMSRPFGYAGYHVEKYCSFLSLDDWIRLIVESTDFEIVDLKPTYYNWRSRSPTFCVRMLRRLVAVPGICQVLAWWDRRASWRYPLEESDTVYVCLRKRMRAQPENGIGHA